MRNIAPFVLLFILFYSHNLFSQDISLYQEGLALKFNDGDIKKLNKYVVNVHELLNEIEAEKNNLEDSLSSAEFEKIRSTINSSSIKLQNKHSKIIEIYQDYIDEFWEVKQEKHYRTFGMDKAKYYERYAQHLINDAGNLRSKIPDAKNIKDAIYLFDEAYKLEKQAILDKGRSINIYQDFPIEYDYGWVDDVDEATVNQFLYGETVAENTDKAEEPETESGVKTRVDTVVIEKIVYVSEDDAKWLPSVIFKVQVAAHNSPITEEEITMLYDGEEEVHEMKEDGWYKYQLGPYKLYSEAQKVLSGCNVENAFIVPYLDGKKVSIKEALRDEFK